MQTHAGEGLIDTAREAARQSDILLRNMILSGTHG